MNPIDILIMLAGLGFLGLFIYFILRNTVSAFKVSFQELQKGFSDITKEVKSNAATHSRILNIEDRINNIDALIRQVPSNILNTVRGANNKLQGDFGEYAASLAIKGEYDRIIYVGDLCDFIGVKYPEGETLGKVHFIEVKTGNASLSKSQLAFRKMISKIKSTETEIEFRVLKISVQSLTKDKDEDKS